jgi:hypothetical protein
MVPEKRVHGVAVRGTDTGALDQAFAQERVMAGSHSLTEAVALRPQAGPPGSWRRRQAYGGQGRTLALRRDQALRAPRCGLDMSLHGLHVIVQ